MTFEQLQATRLPEQEVQEAFGSRTELDEILWAACADDGDDAVMGVVQLAYGSAHQSALFPIATRMPDILAQLLDDRAPAVQVQVLMGLAKHAEPHCHHLGYPGLLPQVFEFERERFSTLQQRAPTEYERMCERTWEAVGRHVRRYAALLEADQRAVVAAALYLLSLLKEWPSGTRERALALARESPDSDTRASAWMALGLNAWATGSGREDLRRGSWTADDDLTVRVAQAIGAAHAAVAEPRSLLADLSAGARQPRLIFDQFPWCAGAIAGPAAEALGVLASDLRDDVVDALIGALQHHRDHGHEKCDDPDWEWPVPELVSEHLVRLVFDEYRGRKDEVTLDELTPMQRRVLVVLFEVGCHPSALSHAGIRRLSRRMVGLDPPGPLDRTITMTIHGQARTWPVWKWWWLTAREGVAEDDLVRQLTHDFDARAVADMALDMTQGDYDIMGRTPRHPVPLAQRLMTAVATDVEPYLKERADLFLHDDTVSSSTLAVVVLPLLRAWRETGKPIDWKYLPLLRRLAGESKSLRDEITVWVPKEDRRRLK